MILYLDPELFSYERCQDVYLCDSGATDEYLHLSSKIQCSCKKRPAILCKSDHDLCRNRCSAEQRLYIKQHNQSNEISIDSRPTNVVLLEPHALESNAEIVYICQREDLPKSILEHLEIKFPSTDASSTDVAGADRSVGRFLFNHSVLAQNAYGMYLTLKQIESNPYQLRRHANLGYFLANILVGVICSLLLFRNFEFNNRIADEISLQTKQLTVWIQSIIDWLMHAPAGLKLNQPLVDFLARFYFYHIYIWSGYLEALLMTVLPHLFQLLFVLCLCGISLAIGAVCDFLRLLTVHLYCFYIYAARLFNWQIRLLISLFRLFCGKKQNPLRNNRVDSHLCDIDQLFVVTISFTILLFLLPTVLMYYAVFTSIYTIPVLIVKLMQYINGFVLQIPIYECYLWLTGSTVMRGTPTLSINYGYSTENTVCFNFHFERVSFLTLYRVCNARPSFSSTSFATFFLAILRGRPAA